MHLICMPSESERNREEKYAIGVERGFLAQKPICKCILRLRYESSLSKTTVKPLSFFLIHSVKLQHKTFVAASASAMNTNIACGHVLCNKSA